MATKPIDDKLAVLLKMIDNVVKDMEVDRHVLPKLNLATAEDGKSAICEFTASDIRAGIAIQVKEDGADWYLCAVDSDGVFEQNMSGHCSDADMRLVVCYLIASVLIHGRE